MMNCLGTGVCSKQPTGLKSKSAHDEKQEWKIRNIENRERL
jgi:hypothetical protein